MTIKFKEYPEIINEFLESFNGNYASFINYGPKLFKLLSDILVNFKYTLKKEDKLEISAALAYFVIPYDIIPEDIYGPYGYIDDIFLCVYVLKHIIDNYGYENIAKNWNEEEDLNEVIKECYEKTTMLIDNTDDILRYVGLIE